MTRLLLFPLLASVAIAQQAALPSFEVAALKPAANGGGVVRTVRGCRKPNPGSVNCTNATLKMLLVQAYEVKNFQVEGPAWMDSDGFDLMARIPSGASVDQIPAMLQALLAERLNVKLHKETRSLPAYDLTIAKGGPKIKALDAAELEAAAAVEPTPAKSAGERLVLPPPGTASIILSPTFRKFRAIMTMERLIYSLTNQLNRPVFDQTGLKGEYDIELSYMVDESDPIASQMRTARSPDAPPIREDASAPIATLIEAVQQSLGLKLESRKAMVDVIVVDSANKVPTEN